MKKNESPFIKVEAAHLGVMKGESDELVNEGVYGKALAGFLAVQLLSAGYTASDPICEDWGWYLSVIKNDFSMDLCIYGFPDYDHPLSKKIYSELSQHPKDSFEEPEGIQLELCVHVGTSRGRFWSWGKFRFVDQTELIDQLHHDILSALEADKEIRIVGTFEEFPLG